MIDDNDPEHFQDPDFDITSYGEVTIDWDNVNMTTGHYDPSILGGGTSWPNITGGASTSNNYVTVNGSGSWNSPSNYVINTSNISTQQSVTFTDSGLRIEDGKDIQIGIRSLSEFMDKVSERLSILQPDPAKLEKHAALRKAYEHYKTIERLIGED